MQLFLDKRRLADSAATSHLGEEPVFAVENPLQIRQPFFATVEFPLCHAATGR
jgi:hypothetical protein